MSDPALKLLYGKLTASRTDVYDKIQLSLQQLDIIYFPWLQFNGEKVVSIGAFLTFYVIFTPLECVQTMSKRLNFFGSKYTINVFNMDFLYIYL